MDITLPVVEDWEAAADQGGSPDEPALPFAVSTAPTPPAALNTPLNALRAELQPIARDLIVDRAYLELVKRNASPRTFLEFVRFAFAADLEGKPGAALNQQIIVQAPFPRGPLDELPPQMRTE